MRKESLLVIVIIIAAVLFGACMLNISKKGRDTVGEKVYEGYTLFTPQTSNVTYLINNHGDVVHTWKGEHYSRNSVYLLENSHLLRTVDPGLNGNETFTAGDAGGKVQEFDWEGNLVWDFAYSSDKHLLHDDIEKLPNGNIMMIAWDYKSTAEAITAGRDPSFLKDYKLWPDQIIEVKPTGPKDGEIVWQWNLWDHLIQDYDTTKENNGDVKKYPERIDINFGGTDEGGGKDWTHINSVDYNEKFDQLLLSVHGFNEIWIIDHSTTISEASGHTGGKSGKGGDILYRWGNPQAYRAGDPEDQHFFGQHDAEWIEEGLPGAGNILVFNNGLNREGPGKGYSTVEEIKTPVDEKGNYQLSAAKSCQPEKPVWIYKADPPDSFYSPYISGAQRLPNGNTFMVSGFNGKFQEVTQKGEIVWRYTNPFGKEKENEMMRETAVYKAERYSADFPGLKNKDLTKNE